MHNLKKLFLFYFLLSISIFALPIKYSPVLMGDITIFIPSTQLKIELAPYVVIKDGDDTVIKANINFPYEVKKYEWREGNRLLSTEETISTEKLGQGEHTLVLTITDKNNLSTSSEILIVKVGHAYLAKQYMTQNIFEIGEPFSIDKDFTPLSSPEYKSLVAFSLDNELLALIDCSLFTADYIVEDYGIFFSIVTRELSDDLKCLYSDVEDNFEEVLNKGIYFNHAVYDENIQISNYNPIFELFPNFDVLSNINDFNFTKFEEELYVGEYIDSPLMNNLFKIKQFTDIIHTDTEKYFTFKTSPKIYIENKQLIVELIDATFHADIIVVDATHIRFSNINRVDIEGVVYPDDIDCNSEIEDICMNDPYIDDNYGEKIFANVMNLFLNETIKVNLHTTDYSFIELKGSKLKLIGNIHTINNQSLH